MQARPRERALPGRDPALLAPWAARAAWAALGAGVLLACAALARAVAGRIGHPFELEWMEGSMLDHVARVRAGRGLYVEPSWEHVAYLYTPLYYWVSALATLVFGLELPTLRGVNLACTLGACAWLGALVARETRSRGAGAVAAAVPVAGYGLVDGWFDVARNDGLFLLLAVAAVHAARAAPRRAWLAAAALVLAFLAKQSALVLAPALCLAAAMLRPRAGLALAAWTALGVGAAVLALHVATDGWSTFFVLRVPRAHGVGPQAELFLRGWRTGVLALWPSALLLPALLARPARPVGAESGDVESGGAWRPRLFWALVAGGLLVLAWASRRHAGGHVNAFLPALLAAGLAAGLALAWLPRDAAALARARGGGERAAERARGWTTAAVAALVLVQGWHLRYDPRRFLPDPGARAAGEALVAWLRERPGDALVLFHGDLAARAGKARTAHGMALWDLLQVDGGESAALAAFHRSLVAAVDSGRIRTIVLDLQFAPQVRLLLGPVLREFELLPESPVADAFALEPPTGTPETWPAWFYVR